MSEPRMNTDETRIGLQTDAVSLMALFCDKNKLAIPELRLTSLGDWKFDWVPAYYRPQYIDICTTKCSFPAAPLRSRNWNWPGATTDKTPYGVIAHELGHHVDWTVSEVKWRYYGNFSKDLHAASGEPPITDYEADKFWEWFAECFRLFLTNAALLKLLRPRTYALLRARFEPVSCESDWKSNLVGDPPERIVSNLQNKIDKCSNRSPRRELFTD